ncbi:MAG TPA: glycosyltransferase [Candidatus Acidoferrum sp.]|nr:glycosyltransferase [Candidatus Acidoferrum sp.]
MNTPLVSILLPVYNGKKFLKECLDSILAQDFANLEILIADDDSSDGSAALLENYAARDGRIRWWKNRQNLGMVENWNSLLCEARGEYIKFVFQDDKLLSASAVSELVQPLVNQPNVILIVSATQVIDEKSRILGTRDHFRPGLSGGKEVIQRCLGQNANLIGEPSVVMFRRSRCNGGFNPQLRHIVDLEFYFRLLEQGDFNYISKPLAAFRQHPDQQSAKNHRNGIVAKEHVWLMQEFLARPWIGQLAKRETQFNLIRSCRKSNTPEGVALKQTVMRRLGRGWFAAYWLKRKVITPLSKLFRPTISYRHPTFGPP